MVGDEGEDKRGENTENQDGYGQEWFEGIEYERFNEKDGDGHPGRVARSRAKTRTRRPRSCCGQGSAVAALDGVEDARSDLQRGRGDCRRSR